MSIYQDEQALTIGNLLKLPFTKIREWKEDEDHADVMDKSKLKE